MDTSKSPAKLSHWGLIFRVCFGVTTLLLLIFFCRPREIFSTLTSVNFLWLALAFGLCFLIVCVRTFRWMLILRGVGLSVPFLSLFRTYMISFWFNTFLPGSVGGDIYKVYDVAAASSRKTRSLVTVIVERLTGVLALVTIAAVAAIAFRDMLPIAPWILFVPIVCVVIGIACTMLAARHANALLGVVWRRVPLVRRAIPEDKVGPIADCIEEIGQKRFVFLISYGFGLLLQILVLYTYYVLALSLDRNISFIYFLIFFPLIEIASMIPISINGMGVREGLLVFFFGYASVPTSFSVSLGLVYRLILIVFAVIGGVLLMAKKKAGHEQE